MAPIKSKSKSNKTVITNERENSQATLYSLISEIQPADLLQRLDKEGISTRGDMAGLRARMLRHELRKIYPETNAALHKDLELRGKEAENWCKMMHLWEIDMRARLKMREQQERSCSIVDKKLEDSMSCAKKVFENDTAERNRVDYLTNCVKLLKSCHVDYSDQSVKDFLGNLNDFRKFADVGDRMMLLMLPFVLKNDAKAWFRAQNFESWQEFEKSFLQRSIVNCQMPGRVAPKIIQQQRPTPQLPHSFWSDIKRNGETIRSQNFASAYQKVEQTRGQQYNPLTRQRSDEERRIPTREHDSEHARYVEYFQQLRLDGGNDKPQTVIRQQRTPADKSIETIALQTDHLESVKKLRIWNVKYNCKENAVQFIEDLNEFRRYNESVSDDVLLDVLPCVLTGNVKTWYRMMFVLNGRWHTWMQFQEAFLKRFYDSVAAKRSLANAVYGLDCCLIK